MKNRPKKLSIIYMHPERGNYYFDRKILRLKSANLIDFLLILFKYLDKAYLLVPKTDRDLGEVIFKVEENVDIMTIPFPEIRETIIKKIISTSKFIISLLNREVLFIINSVDYSVSGGYSFAGTIFGIVRTCLCKKKHSFIIRGNREKTVKRSSRKPLNKKLTLLRIYMYEKIMIYLLETGRAELWFQGDENYNNYLKECSLDTRKRLFLLNAVLRDLHFSNSIKEKRRVFDIIYVGRITIEKGILDLIKAISILVSNKIYISVVIVGDGPDMNYATELTNKLGLNNLIKFIGFVNSPKEVAKLLSSAKLFVLPSYTEGMPRSMVESMCIGTPVLVTPVGGIESVIKDGKNGFLVEPFSPNRLAEKITTILANIETKEMYHLINLAKKDSEKYSFNLRAKYFLRNSINNPNL